MWGKTRPEDQGVFTPTTFGKSAGSVVESVLMMAFEDVKGGADFDFEDGNWLAFVL